MYESRYGVTGSSPSDDVSVLFLGCLRSAIVAEEPVAIPAIYETILAAVYSRSRRAAQEAVKTACLASSIPQFYRIVRSWKHKKLKMSTLEDIIRDPTESPEAQRSERLDKFRHECVTWQDLMTGCDNPVCPALKPAS
jgi:hypothetical protein